MSKKSEIRSAVTKYIVGFGLSLVFTLGAFGLVLVHVSSRHEELPHSVLVPAVIILAVAQLVVQLFFFLHLGRESRPRWNLTVFLFMLLTLVIVVLGSLWIMQNLNYNMMHMSPGQTSNYMYNHQGGF